MRPPSRRPGPLPGAWRTRLPSLLRLGQSVVSLPAHEESGPVSSAPDTSPPHPQAHPTARPPGEPRPLRPHPHPVLGQLAAQGTESPRGPHCAPAFTLHSRTWGAYGGWRGPARQPQHPAPVCGTGFLRTLARSHSPTALSTGPDVTTSALSSTSGLSPRAWPTCSLLPGWGQTGRRQRG